MTNSIYIQTLPSKTAQLIQRFQKMPFDMSVSFYLSGGTALSLQIGHRESEDLDFFCQKRFDPQKVQIALLKYGKLEQTVLDQGTLNTFLNGVKLQFLEYPYDLLEPLTNWKSIQLSSVADIACTKLQTISMRGNKKDFVDMYFLLKKYSLEALLALVEKKYVQVNYNKTHILKSLVYFRDAKDQPMPKLHKEVSWDEVKKKMIQVVKNIRFVAV